MCPLSLLTSRALESFGKFQDIFENMSRHKAGRGDSNLYVKPYSKARLEIISHDICVVLEKNLIEFQAIYSRVPSTGRRLTGLPR
jgi:hypothetical protein